MQRHFRAERIRATILIITIISIATIGYAGNSTISVSAVVLSDNNCTFGTHTASLNFGNLDPANPVDRTLSTSVQFRCGGRDTWATFSISDNGGLYSTGPDAPRMRRTAAPIAYLPYSLDLNPITATVRRRTWQTLTISATVRGVDYQDAAMGNYRDTVAISIEP
jgi:spore coat protein U-like protein